MNLIKFMHFCKDFGLVDLTMTMGRVTEMCGECRVLPPASRKQLKYPVAKKENTTTKVYLAEAYKKSTANKDILTRSEFEGSLRRVGA
jgi:hypothetical protein